MPILVWLTWLGLGETLFCKSENKGGQSFCHYKKKRFLVDQYCYKQTLRQNIDKLIFINYELVESEKFRSDTYITFQYQSTAIKLFWQQFCLTNESKHPEIYYNYYSIFLAFFQQVTIPISIHRFRFLKVLNLSILKIQYVCLLHS